MLYFFLGQPCSVLPFPPCPSPSLFTASSSLFPIRGFSLMYPLFLSLSSILLHYSLCLLSSSFLFHLPIARSPLVSEEHVFHRYVTLSHVICMFRHEQGGVFMWCWHMQASRQGQSRGHDAEWEERLTRADRRIATSLTAVNIIDYEIKRLSQLHMLCVCSSLRKVIWWNSFHSCSFKNMFMKFKLESKQMCEIFKRQGWDIFVFGHIVELNIQSFLARPGGA